MKPEVGEQFMMEGVLMEVVDAPSFDQWLPVRPVAGGEVVQRTAVYVRTMIASHKRYHPEMDFYWEAFIFGNARRYQLYANGKRTPFFIDRVPHYERVNGMPYTLFGAGMHPRGIALALNYFHLLKDAKAAAIEEHKRVFQEAASATAN